MEAYQLNAILTGVLAAVACALPGVFLVLRRLALVSDAIGHVVLLGIVLGFLLVGELGSPVLLVGAAATGLVLVAAVEALQRTRLVREDAAIGLVFPALFSLGVILVSRYARNVHLDVDAVLLGDLVYAAESFPTAILVVLLLNVVFLSLCYKELKLATFDPQSAWLLGLAPGCLHYALMGLVSLTAVVAFDVFGSILVVAFMVVPALIARLLTDRLGLLLVLAGLVAAVAAVVGCGVALALDINFAGAMTAVLGGGLFVVWARYGATR
jgi:manganese/zinc/iron transport system permease protein